MKIQDIYISVIIPTYNREKTIKKAIESVLNQTHNKLELIVVDDCSKDNTEEIVRSIEDKRLKYIKLKKNKGANYARNKGIELSKYDLVAFQDSDDIWHENKLEIQIKFLIKNNFEFIGSKYNQFLENKFNAIIPKFEIKEKDYLKILLEKGNFLSTQTFLGYKYIFIAERFDENLPRLQDYDFIIRIVKKYRVGFINFPLVDVYLQDNSISKDISKLYIANKIILKKYFKDFSYNKKNMSKLYLSIYTSSLLINKKDKESLKLSLKYNITIKNIIFKFLNIINLDEKIYILYFKLRSRK